MGYINVQNQLSKLKESIFSSIKQTDNFLIQSGSFWSVLDDENEYNNYTGPETTSIQEFINYVRDANGLLNVVCDNGRTVQLQYEYIDDDHENILCLNDGNPETFIHTFYSEGAGNRVFTVYNSLYDLDNNAISLSDAILQSRDTWCTNTIMYSAIETIQEKVQLGTVWNANEVNNFISSFNDKVSQSIDISALSSSNTKQMYDMVVRNAKSGLVGLLYAIKKTYDVLSSANQGADNAVHFINNNDFVSKSFLSGILTTIATGIGSVIASIASIFSRVAGLIAGAITLCVQVVSKFVNSKWDESVYATYSNTSSLLDDEFPFVIYKHLFEYGSGSDYNFMRHNFGDQLDENGYMRIFTPIAYFYIWRSDDSDEYDIAVQARPLANSYFCITDLPSITKTYVSDSDIYDKVTFDISGYQSFSDFIESLTGYIELKVDNIDNTLTGQDMDNELKRRFAGCYNITAIMLAYFYMVAHGLTTYTANINGGVHQYLDTLLIGASYLLDWYDDTALSYYKNKSWNSFIDENTGLVHIVLESTDYIKALLYGFNINSEVFSELYSLNVVSYDAANINPSPITLPKYDKKDVILSSILLGIAVATVVAVSVVVGVKSISKINNKRTQLAAKAETNWESYKANPTTANYKAYRKQVKKNNRFASIFGGTKYSTQGFWASSEQSTADALEQLNDNLFSIKDSGVALDTGDTNGILTLINLIHPLS